MVLQAELFLQQFKVDCQFVLILYVNNVNTACMVFS